MVIMEEMSAEPPLWIEGAVSHQIQEQFVDRRAQNLLDRGLYAVQSGDYVTALQEFRLKVEIQQML